MNNEVSTFAKAIGATPMILQTASNERRLFARSNYFQTPSVKLIVKISRIKRPFWGVGVKQIEILEAHGPYYLVLLVSDQRGGFLSHAEIEKLRLSITSPGWSRGEDDNENQYKINAPLPPATNWFESPAEFLKMTTITR